MSTMVFVNTADEASIISARLRGRGVDCAEFHKLLSSQEKETEFVKFREGKVKVLVCTDSASR